MKSSPGSSLLLEKYIGGKNDGKKRVGALVEPAAAFAAAYVG